MKISSFSMHFLALAAAICMVSIKAQRPQQEEAAKFYVSRFDIENGFGETSPDELSSEFWNRVLKKKSSKSSKSSSSSSSSKSSKSSKSTISPAPVTPSPTPAPVTPDPTPQPTTPAPVTPTTPSPETPEPTPSSKSSKSSSSSSKSSKSSNRMRRDLYENQW